MIEVDQPLVAVIKRKESLKLCRRRGSRGHNLRMLRVEPVHLLIYSVDWVDYSEVDSLEPSQLRMLHQERRVVVGLRRDRMHTSQAWMGLGLGRQLSEQAMATLSLSLTSAFHKSIRWLTRSRWQDHLACIMLGLVVFKCQHRSLSSFTIAMAKMQLEHLAHKLQAQIPQLQVHQVRQMQTAVIHHPRTKEQESVLRLRI